MKKLIVLLVIMLLPLAAYGRDCTYDGPVDPKSLYACPIVSHEVVFSRGITFVRNDIEYPDERITDFIIIKFARDVIREGYESEEPYPMDMICMYGYELAGVKYFFVVGTNYDYHQVEPEQDAT